MKISIRQYQNLSKFFYDVAKLTFAGLAIGSVISKKSVSPFIFIAGLGLTIVFAFIAIWLDKEDRR